MIVRRYYRGMIARAEPQPRKLLHAVPVPQASSRSMRHVGLARKLQEQLERGLRAEQGAASGNIYIPGLPRR